MSKKLNVSIVIPVITPKSICKISVIIPVYNMAKYLRQCLDSILKQTMQDFEVFCIDDASTDKSCDILFEYAKKDNRFHLIFNKVNQKQGVCRNKAIRQARGEYIFFLDADDYVDLSLFELLYTKAKKENLDMLNFAGTNFDSKTGKMLQAKFQDCKYVPKEINGRPFNYKDCLKYKFPFPMTCCRIFYSRKFLIDNDIRFLENIYFEDTYFTYKALFLAQKINVLDKILYFRRVHKNSTTQNWERHFGDYIECYSLLYQYFQGRKDCLSDYKDDNIDLMWANTVTNRYIKYSYKTQKRYFEQMKKFLSNIYAGKNLEKLKNESILGLLKANTFFEYKFKRVFKFYHDAYNQHKKAFLNKLIAKIRAKISTLEEQDFIEK